MDRFGRGLRSAQYHHGGRGSLPDSMGRSRAPVSARNSAKSSAAEFAPARSISCKAGASVKAGIKPALLAAEMVLGAGGFGLVVIDLALDIGGHTRTLALSAALRLARAAERSGSAVIVLAERRTCGTFAALSLVLGRTRPFFSRMAPGAPMLFDGIRVEAYVARNKLGGSGQAAVWRASSIQIFPRQLFPRQLLSPGRWRIRGGPSKRIAEPGPLRLSASNSICGSYRRGAGIRGQLPLNRNGMPASVSFYFLLLFFAF